MGGALVATAVTPALACYDVRPFRVRFGSGLPMPVPNYQVLMLPLLQELRDGKPHVRRAVRDSVATALSLDDVDLAERIPSGKQGVFRNRFGWAKTHLSKAGAVTAPDRGTLLITDRGRAILAEEPEAITSQLLRRFPEYQEFVGRSGDGTPAPPTSDYLSSAGAAVEVDPRTVFDDAFGRMSEQLQDELLERLKTVSPRFFERLVVDVLLAMGYGGFRAEAGKTTQYSKDGGIDGVINEDRLGLDAIYVQAKRYKEATIGRPVVQAFVGSLQGERARKGVFITTSTFTADARAYVERLDVKVALVDGSMLAGLMIEHNVGVSTESKVEVKRVDGDYFEEA